jgi:hypothetical protein
LKDWLREGVYATPKIKTQEKNDKKKDNMIF